jgi:DNA polymerase I-like protein with 3'-5' exonuclease and polymerase domains
MRFFSAFNLAGTKSFRLSSRKFLSDYGGNGQNQPESIRQYLVADAGKVIIQRDQSGAEALIVAHLARPGNYLQLFQHGIKPHTYIALNIFIEKFSTWAGHSQDRYYLKSPKELTALPEWKDLNAYISGDEANAAEYALGKMTAHAKSYDMGANTFRINVLQRSAGRIRLTAEQAKQFLTTFEVLFPEIIEWQTEIKEELRSKRVLTNLFGHPRQFYQRWSAELFREALSFKPQSTVGVLTSYAETEVQQKIEAEGLDWDVLLNVHDALVMQVPNDENNIRYAMATLDKAFKRPLPSRHSGTFVMKSEGMYGPSWAKSSMKKWKDN